ncbi:hypothetical protein [Burkholderia pyrrocinia]|uniref:hypothetical protein n=1 Tax=Burkholderia pyrrocinia TaxID=60550 RepID=UPI001BCBDAB2|nr:hypothetical protein [Burkholderia pyrrocinia]QVN19579.1 hypothetical protein JYG32_07660 [Burkholderia pyrrocinia]
MKKIISFTATASIAFALLWTSTAYSQFSPGQVLTASQLNQAFSNVLPLSGGALTGPLTVPTLTSTNVAITGGAINGTAIGGSAPSAAAFTTINTGSASVSGALSVAGAATATSISIPTSSGTNPITLVNNNNNQIAWPSGSSIQLNGSGSIQFGGSVNGALLSNDGAPNDIVMVGPSNLAGYDTNFVLYPSPQAGAFLVVNRVGGPNQEQFIFGAPDPATNAKYLFSQVIDGAGHYRPVQFNGGAIDAFTLTTSGNVQFDNHVSAASSALGNVTMSNCGTGASAAFANDVRGTLVMGTGSVTSCTVTFNQAYASTPSCVITGLGSGTAVLSMSALSTAGFTIASSADISGKYVTYMCMQ